MQKRWNAVAQIQANMTACAYALAQVPTCQLLHLLMQTVQREGLVRFTAGPHESFLQEQKIGVQLTIGCYRLGQKVASTKLRVCEQCVPCLLLGSRVHLWISRMKWKISNVCLAYSGRFVDAWCGGGEIDEESAGAAGQDAEVQSQLQALKRCHADSEHQQQNAAGPRSASKLNTCQQENAKRRFQNVDEPGQRWHRHGRRPGCQLGHMWIKTLHAAPRHAGLTHRAPQSHPVGNGRNKRTGQRDTGKDQD